MAAVDSGRAKEAQQWMETVLGIKMTDFFEDIRDGVLLCQVVNKIKANTCRKFKKSKIAYVARTNIQIYLEGCKKLGIPETDRFESRDLYDQQRLGQVVDNIFCLSAISRKHGFSGPFIGNKYAEKNERNFSAEVLAKSSVPMWNRGDKHHKQDHHDSRGIVRAKGLDKHAGGLSKWEKGSRASATGAAHDSVGIVRGKGLEKHSGGMSKWDKGAKSYSTGASHDSVGIVRGKGLEKHSGGMSKWEKGSKAYSTGDSHDSVGIVRGKGLEKHSGGQSAWDKGAKSYSTGPAHDGVGVVRGAGLDKHSGGQSKWEKGSRAHGTGATHDSVGVVRGAGLDKHSGAQSKWETGAKAHDSSSKHDSYGIVRTKDY